LWGDEASVKEGLGIELKNANDYNEVVFAKTGSGEDR